MGGVEGNNVLGLSLQRSLWRLSYTMGGFGMLSFTGAIACEYARANALSLRYGMSR